jgi:hypothetical protein
MPGPVPAELPAAGTIMTREGVIRSPVLTSKALRRSRSTAVITSSGPALVACCLALRIHAETMAAGLMPVAMFTRATTAGAM